jgi:hypothetical protein
MLIAEKVGHLPIPDNNPYQTEQELRIGDWPVYNRRADFVAKCETIKSARRQHSGHRK